MLRGAERCHQAGHVRHIKVLANAYHYTVTFDLDLVHAANVA
jgi:hypothetical protein